MFIFAPVFAQNNITPEEYGWKQNTNMDQRFVNRTYLDVQFLKDDPRYGWICGFQGSFLRTTDSGQSWETYEIFGSNISAGDGQLESLHFLNKDVGYLTVASHPTTDLGTTYKTVDGGITWKKVLEGFILDEAGNKESFWGHYFLNENIGVVLGGDCTSDQFFHKTTDGGKTWSYFKTNHELETKLADPILYADGTGYAVSSGLLWQSSDYGSTWEVLAPTRSTTTYDLKNAELVYTSPDTEATYTTQSGNIISIELVDLNLIRIASDTDTLFINGSFFNDYITNSADDTVYISGNLFDIYMTEEIFGSNTVTSSDWHEEISNIGESFFIPYSETCSGDAYEGKAGFMFTTDMGNNWTEIPTPGPNYGTFLLDETTGWGCGFYETVVYTSDAGNSWTNINCGFPDNTNLDDIWFVDDTTGWVVGDGIYKLTKINKIKPKIIPEDTLLLCRNETLELQTSESFNEYYWNTGARTRSITIKKPGIYYLSAYKNFICDLEYSDTVYVQEAIPELIEISSSGSNPLCEGDSLLLTAQGGFFNYQWSNGESSRSIYVRESNTYSVTAEDSNGCDVYADYEVYFNPIPDPRIIPSNKLSICRGQELTLTAKPDNHEYLWVFNKENDPENEFIFSDMQSIEPDSSGFYRVIVTTGAGCSTISDEIFVEIKEDSNRLSFRFDPNEIPVDIDSTNYPVTTCRDLIISNNSPDEQIVGNAYFVKNTAFTLPVSQFSVIVPPYDEAKVRICYSPTELAVQRDTLILPDRCSPHSLPIVSTGIGNNYNSPSRCDIALEFNTIDIYKKYKFSGEFPFPNPADNIVNIDFIRTRHSNEPVQENVYLVNSFGTKVASANEVIMQVESEEQQIKEFGKYIIQTDGLNSGAYFVVIENSAGTRSYPLMISR